MLIGITASALTISRSGVWYSLNETSKEATVTYKDTNYNSYSGDIVIEPWFTYNGVDYTVASIGEKAFYNSTSLTSVTIPLTVTWIQANAFGNCSSSFNKIKILYSSPSEILTNSAAFSGTSMSNISLYVEDAQLNGFQSADVWKNCGHFFPMDYWFRVHSSGHYTYYRLTGFRTGTERAIVVSGSSNGDVYSGEIEIPSSVPYGGRSYTVKEVGPNAFENCTGMTKVKFASTIEDIDSYAFSGCSGLTALSLPSSLKYIYPHAFQGCSGITELNFSYPYKVQEYAFQNCSGLKTITFKNNAEGFLMSEGIFDQCLALESITIRNITDPYSFNLLGEKVFWGVDQNGVKVYVPEGSTTAYRNHALWGKFLNIKETGSDPYYDFERPNPDGTIIYYKYNGDGSTVSVAYRKKTGVSYTGDIVIPDYFQFGNLEYTVTDIGPEAFRYYSDGVTSVTLPWSVTNIAESAFQNASKMTSINLDFVYTIGDKAFMNCSKLGNVNLSPDLTSIGNSAFYRCYDMTSLVIPDGVTRIGDQAFYECTGLEEVTLGESLAYMGVDAFYFCQYVKQFNVKIDDPAKVTLDADVFYGCDKDWAVLKVPAGTKALFAVADQWKDFKHIEEDFQAGDVNCDGKINSADITFIVQHLLGNTPDGFNATNADVNQDGVINSADLTAIILINLGSN